MLLLCSFHLYSYWGNTSYMNSQNVLLNCLSYPLSQICGRSPSCCLTSYEEVNADVQVGGPCILRDPRDNGTSAVSQLSTVADYNVAIKGFNVGDQMASYYPMIQSWHFDWITHCVGSGSGLSLLQIPPRKEGVRHSKRTVTCLLDISISSKLLRKFAVYM